MPWRETSAEVERMKFIVALEAADPSESFTEICRRAGVSRPTGYKWKKRFEEEGVAALSDRRPLAHHHANATPEDVADAIVALRKAHPTWGPKKLRQCLINARPEVPPPAVSTIGQILDRRGMITPRKRRMRVPPAGVAASSYSGPNAVWCSDHKGHFALADGTRCGPLTLIDGFSRYLLRCEMVASTSDDENRPHLESAMREFGLPAALRSDGGVPFASSSTPGRLTRLAVWLIKLGIELHRNDPGRPDQNGRLERFHKTMEEAIAGGPYTREVQGRRFDALRREYNHERPHEALGQKTPVSAYETSWRPFPEVLKSPDYPTDKNVRRADDTGRVVWLGHRIKVGRPLSGEPVFFEPLDEARWDVRFGAHFLFHLDLHGGTPNVAYVRPPTPDVHDGELRPPPAHRP